LVQGAVGRKGTSEGLTIGPSMALPSVDK
jgi:hypothetical protein